MRTLATCLFLTFGSVAAAQEQPPPKPAQPPPVKTEPAKEQKTLALGSRVERDLVLKDLDGKEHKVGGQPGKITVINFYSIECPIQAGWDKRLGEVQEEFTSKGVVFLNVASNLNEIGLTAPEPKEGEKPYDNIRRHLKAKDLPYTVLADHGNVAADAFGAKTTPEVFVFGKDGRLVYRGLIDDDQRGEKGDKATRYLHDVLTKLLAGETVEPKQTTPVGCTIKRAPKPATAK